MGMMGGALSKGIKVSAILVGMAFFYGHAGADGWENTLVIGVRGDCPPFAEAGKKDEADTYNGYSVDLCKKIAKAAEDELDIRKVEYMRVSAKDRFCKLKSKKVRMLCGATTVTLKGLNLFGTSMYTFISGASLMYLPALNRSVRLETVNVGVLEGTTTSQTVDNILKRQTDIDFKAFPKTRILRLPSHSACLDQFATQGKDALHVYIADREILLALNRLAAKRQLKLKVSSQYYTVEPYALFMHKDDHDLLNLANKTLSGIFKTEIYDIYSDNFPGSRMNISLRHLFQFQQLPEGKPLTECP